MPRAKNGAVELEYETFGDAAGEAVLLINGLGSQMTRWPAPFCDLLVQRGLYAIRFDNRDVGLSTWCEGVRYTADDMAADAAAVLTAAGKRQAHIVGVSMGGMIAQLFAANYPERTLSLVSIMSNAGSPAPAAQPNVALLDARSPDPESDFEGFVAAGVAHSHAIGSPLYPWDDAFIRQRVIDEHRRAYHPAGVGHQRAAIAASGDRRPKLATINAPTVVMHGADDPLVPVAGGKETADNIAGAEFVVVPGMGHNLPPSLYDKFVETIWRAVARARAAQPATA